jgi:hypothetical protein
VSTGLLEAPVEDLLRHEDPESVAHIVSPVEGKTGHALVMEARIYGFPVEALCGHRFVPRRDAKALPVCQPCKDLMDERFGAGHGDNVEQ